MQAYRLLLNKYDECVVDYKDAKKDDTLTNAEVNQYKSIAQDKAKQLRDVMTEFRNFLVDYCESVVNDDESKIFDELFDDIDSRIRDLEHLTYEV